MFYDAEVYEYFSKNDDWVWYTVEVGDSDGLSNIAYKFYRDAGLWPEICVFNRDKLGTQSRCREEVLLIGMRLRIPMLTPPAPVTIRPEDTSPTPTNTQTPEPPILTATITPSDTLSPTPTPTPKYGAGHDPSHTDAWPAAQTGLDQFTDASTPVIVRD